MILSIVIPVYNVEKYIEKCLLSCANQNISKEVYEIIVVNDGSPDNSVEICKNLLSTIENMTIVSQENRGLSGARNTGLKHASGDYVWFVDSDDWIKENSLQQIVSELKTQQSDIFWLGHDVVADGEVIDSFIPKQIETPIFGQDFFVNHLNNLFYIWKFIYKREFLLKNNLTFYEGILYEDLEFTPRALYLAKSCYTMPSIYYHYLMRDGSIINNFKTKNLESRFFIFDRLVTYMKENTVSEPFYKVCYQSIISSVISTLRTSARSNLKLTKTVKETIKNLEVKPFLKKKDIQTLKLIKLNPDLYVFAFKSLYKGYRLLKK